jgi:alkylation response protein AidB-like acyl-CoA dehydrogenase
MKFLLTEEQNYIQKATRDFTKGEFDDDQILDLLEKKCFPKKMLKNACKLDLIGLTYPEAAGGQACEMMDNVLVIEELCRRDSTMGISLSTVDMGVELIARYGDKKMVKTWVSPVLKGKAVSALICPELGQEKSSVSYRKEGEDLVLKGEAPLVINAGIADYFILVADPEDDASTDKRILAVIPRETQGICVGESCDKLGLDMLAWHKVSFDDAKISVANLVLADPKEIDPLLVLQQNNLMKISAMFLGIAQGAFDLALGYARSREQFRRKIALFQGISQKIAQMYIRLQEGRAAVYNAASLYDRGGIDLHDLIAVKLTAQSVAELLTDEALQIHGGVGYMVEFPIEHFFRDVKCLRTFMGRKIFETDIISQKLIGNIK